MRNCKSRIQIYLGVCLMILSGLTVLFGQEFRATVNGNVTDPNGAAIPGANVTLTNTETNIAVNGKTDESGNYTFPLIQPGKYKITVAAEGFKTSVNENLTVNVDDRLSIDLKLEIGQTAEVNVVADAELIEKSSVTIGTVVSTRQIAELPLAEGAPYTLATQAPGVVYTGDPNFQGPTANGNLAGFRSNGAAGNQINLDGSPNLAYSGQVAFTPPSDAVQEFKVQTNSFDAQNGFTAGSTVNVALKSGTNKLHGSTYLFDRAKSRTANNFFNNRSGRERPGRKYDRYGAVINGPVRFPFLYNGKDKTFFLFSYERQKDNVAQPTTYSVPTALMRTGDFTELLVDRTNVAAAANTIIYNPFSGVTSGSNVVRSSFGCPTSGAIPAGSSCNIIPANLIYQPALNFLKLFPAPNLPGITNNYITDQNLIRPYRSYLGKIDHNFNANNRLSGKYYHSRNTEDRYNLTQEEGSIFQGFENRRNNGGNIDYTSTLTSSFILDVRASYNQFKLKRYQGDQPTAASLGFTGIPASRTNLIFPRFDFRNYLTVGSLRSDYNNGQERPFDLYSVQPTVTQIYGNHTIKYGYDFRHLRERFSSLGYAAGRFLFDGTYTMPASNSGSTARDLPGRDLASFLLGVPVTSTSGSIIDNPTDYDASSVYNAGFVQDDFRFSQKINFNLGLRYEYEGGVKEKEGRIVVDFDRTVASPIRAQAIANYNASVPAGVPITPFTNLSGGLVFASDADQPNQKTDKNNFQPRLGFSYAINDKTVVRIGAGIFTAPFQIQTIFQPGFSTPTAFTASTNNGLTVTTLANPFPTGIVPSPGAAQGLLTFTGRDVTSANGLGPSTFVLSNERKNANYTRFVFGIQRELPFKLGIEATYVYSRGKDLAVSRELNAIPREYLNDFSNTNLTGAQIITQIAAQNTFLNASVSNPLRGLIPDGGTFGATTIQRRRLLTPFPQFGNIAVTEYNGSSEYQSLQLQMVKRFTKGLSLNGSYTFSREHQATSYLNPQDTQLANTVSPTERPHRFTASSIYELPFGKGREYFSNWNPIVNALLGGWQIQGVYEWQSGEPLQFGNLYYTGDINNLVSKLGKKDENGLRYGIDIPAFDVTGFYVGGVAAAANVPGFANNFTSSSANTLRYLPLATGKFRNQRFLKFDLGMSKNFRIKEGMKFQIRVEAINTLNTPYFSAPILDPTQIPNLTDPNANNLGRFGFTNAPTRQPPRDIQIGGRFTF